MVENIAPDETLDCIGLSCPMPLLKTKKAIKRDEIRADHRDYQL